MTIETINSISQILLVVHTVILYPILKYAFLIEKRFTKIETELQFIKD